MLIFPPPALLSHCMSVPFCHPLEPGLAKHFHHTRSKDQPHRRADGPGAASYRDDGDDSGPPRPLRLALVSRVPKPCSVLNWKPSSTGLLLCGQVLCCWGKTTGLAQKPLAWQRGRGPGAQFVQRGCTGSWRQTGTMINVKWRLTHGSLQESKNLSNYNTVTN